MAKDSFEGNSAAQTNWFPGNRFILRSAVKAIRMMLPVDIKNAIEISCGPARFCQELGLTHWAATREITSPKPGGRCCDVLLPFDNFALDCVFVSHSDSTDEFPGIFKEIHRTLKMSGTLALAFIDSASPLARSYWHVEPENPKFNTEAIMFQLTNAGFRHFEFIQTLFSPPEHVCAIDEARPGYGEGAFVVVKATKKI